MITESILRKLIRRELLKEKKKNPMVPVGDSSSGSATPGEGLEQFDKPSGNNKKSLKSLKKLQKVTKDINSKLGFNWSDLSVKNILAMAKEKNAVIVFLDAPTVDFTFDRSNDPKKDPRVLSQFVEDINSHIQSNKASLKEKAVEQVCSYKSDSNKTSSIYKLNSSIWTNPSVTNSWFNLYDLIVKSGSEVGNNLSQIKRSAKNKEYCSKISSKSGEFNIDPLQVAIGNSARGMMKNSWFDLNRILEKENKESILLIDPENNSRVRIIGKSKVNQCVQKIENSDPVDKILQDLDTHNKNVEKAKNSITIGELKKLADSIGQYLNVKNSDDYANTRKTKARYIKRLNKLAKKIEKSSNSKISFDEARKIINKNYWSGAHSSKRRLLKIKNRILKKFKARV